MIFEITIGALAIFAFIVLLTTIFLSIGEMQRRTREDEAIAAFFKAMREGAQPSDKEVNHD